VTEPMDVVLRRRSFASLGCLAHPDSEGASQIVLAVYAGEL
jgi:hypothetical protein